MGKTTSKLLLVTGCGRSGTKYTANVLRSCGVDVPHEWMGEHGTVSWYFNIDDGKPPFHTHVQNGKAAHQGDGERRANFEFQNVFHQIRHPLKVIPSAVKVYDKEDWAYIQRGTGIPYKLHDDAKVSRIMRSALHWLRWNEIAAKTATYTYRIEDIDERWPEMREILRIPAHVELPKTSKSMNHQGGYREPEVLTWKKFYNYAPEMKPIAKEVWDRAKEYGYE